MYYMFFYQPTLKLKYMQFNKNKNEVKKPKNDFSF